MEIKLVSSLTPEDEFRLAPAVVDLLGELLSHYPIAFTLRVETSAGRSFAHHHLPVSPAASQEPSLAAVPAGLHS